MCFSYKIDANMKVYVKFVGYYINSLYLCSQLEKQA